MTDKTLEVITEAGPLDGTEKVYITQDGNSRWVDIATLAAYISTAESIVPENLPWRGCRAVRTSNQTSITWPIAVSWQAEDIDTDSIWSIGDPTKLVVPAGVTKVRIQASVVAEAGGTAGGLSCTIRKNQTGTGDTPVQGSTSINARQTTTGSTTNVAQAWTDVIDVTSGDYFDLVVQSTMSGIDQLLFGSSTWFTMEIVEADLVT